MLRLQFPGACYHLINRGNYRGAIFAKDSTKRAFVQCLFETVARTGWLLHAWCLLSNHYHLAAETPAPNLVAGMRERTTAPNRWLSEQLQMGSPSTVSRTINECRRGGPGHPHYRAITSIGES
jgi:hypothetical protein